MVCKMRPVIIPVETKSREFHGKLFLALRLIEKGHRVLLGHQARLWEYADLLPPSIYLDKSVANTHVNWTRRCRAMGHDVVAWDEEGLVFFDSWMFRKLRIDPKALDQVTRFFAWGKAQRNAICEEYPQYKDHIALCGNPRFDFLRPELRAFYKPEVSAIKKRFGPMLLVNTNFALYNHFKSPEELREQLKKYPLSDEPGYMDGWIAMHKHAHEAYLEMVPELLARYPNHAIVLRPHPSENHEPWRELAKNHPRLHVDSTGNVHEWILASEAVIHFNCTTAIEAFLLDVPAIAYRPGRYPRYENPLPNALSESAFSLDELWQALNGRTTAKERGALWTDEQWQIAAHNMASTSGPTAAERIANEITNMVSAQITAKPSAQKRLLAAAKLAWRRRLHAKREMQRGRDAYTAQKFPGIEADEVHSLLNRMARVSGSKANFEVREFARHCHWILPRNRRSA